MKAYATFFFLMMLVSLCFVDSGIQAGIAKAGRLSFALSGVLLLITGAIALFS